MVKLRIEYDFDFYLAGIACHERDYRICHEINSALPARLEKGEEYVISPGKGKETSRHSFYFYKGEYDIRFYIIANKGTSALLIPEQKQLDYFLLIKGGIFDEDKEAVLKKLKNIPIISGVFELNPQKLKSRENLVF